MSITTIANLVTPSVFDDYVQQFTEQKDTMLASGMVVPSPALDAKLAGGGSTFNVPAFAPLGTDAAILGTDTDATITPLAHAAVTEQAVRLSRSQAWSTADLTGLVTGSDPMASIASQVATYWNLQKQASLIAIMVGVFADNTDNDTGDMSSDISGAAYAAGLTDFSAEAAIDAMVTSGDSMQDFTGIIMHSVVYARLLKNNLIDFEQDSKLNTRVPTFLGLRVIVNDNITNATNVYDTWFFGPGAIQYGRTPAPNPTAIQREELQGQGFGVEILVNRQVWTYHPVGFAYGGAATLGGPADTVLDDAASWDRVYSERKQIKIARLVTREA